MSGRLQGRLVVLGVTGSIAAYKAVELLRLLAAEGAEVQVLMTHAARAFVGPLTLETLSRRPVLSDALELLPDKRIAHIVASERASAIVVAPATAHWMAAMAAAHALAAAGSFSTTVGMRSGAMQSQADADRVEQAAALL